MCVPKPASPRVPASRRQPILLAGGVLLGRDGGTGRGLTGRRKPGKLVFFLGGGGGGAGGGGAGLVRRCKLWIVFFFGGGGGAGPDLPLPSASRFSHQEARQGGRVAGADNQPPLQGRHRRAQHSSVWAPRVLTNGPGTPAGVGRGRGANSEQQGVPVYM